MQIITINIHFNCIFLIIGWETERSEIFEYDYIDHGSSQKQPIQDKYEKIYCDKLAHRLWRLSSIVCHQQVGDLAKGESSSLFLLFVLFGSSTDWMMMFTHTGGDNLLSTLVQMLISSRNIFTDRNKV